MKKLYILFSILVLFPLSANSQSIVGKWKITSQPSEVSGLPVLYWVEYKADNICIVGITMFMEIPDIVKTQIIMTMPGKYKCSGKALSQTFNTDATQLQIKNEFAPSVSLEVRKRIESEYEKMRLQIKPGLLSSMRVFSSAGMYKQILMLNHETMVVGRMNTKEEVFKRILSEENLREVKNKREMERAAYIQAQQRNSIENESVTVVDAEAERLAAEKVAAERAEAERHHNQQLYRKGAKIYTPSGELYSSLDFSDVSARQLYEKGSSQMKAGKYLYMASGAGLALGGVGLLSMMTSKNDSAYSAGMISFVSGLIVTPVCAITGLILNQKGKTKIEKALSTEQGEYTGTVSIGMQSNGVGIAFVF